MKTVIVKCDRCYKQIDEYTMHSNMQCDKFNTIKLKSAHTCFSGIDDTNGCRINLTYRHEDDLVLCDECLTKLVFFIHERADLKDFTFDVNDK